MTLCVALAWIPSAHAEGQRVALVVGISDYQAVTALPNAGRDAHSVGDALRANGFAVTELTNPAVLDRAKLSMHLLAFRRAAEGAEAAVIYFAGHGVEWRGKNWLLPRDASADTPDALEVTALASSALVNAVSLAGKVRLVVLDACRDNPFATRVGWSTGTRAAAASRGLAREKELPPNVVVLLATQPEERASDGQGTPNSPFAMAFATALKTPGIRLYQLPTVVARAMRQQAAIDQRPDVQGIFDEPDWSFSVAPVMLPERPASATVATRSEARQTIARPSVPPPTISQPPMEQFVTRREAAATGGAVAARLNSQTSDTDDPVGATELTRLGLKYALAQNYGEAMRLFRQAADLGNAGAMRNVGLMYDAGQGVTTDYAEAVRWFRMAADRGDADGMLALGLRYSKGQGLPQDYSEAMRWYRKAAELGNSSAMNNIGVLYVNGAGMTTYDNVEAMRWFRMAADLGNPDAMRMVGTLYRYGGGVPKSDSEARHWYLKAAAAGDEASKKHLAEMGYGAVAEVQSQVNRQREQHARDRAADIAEQCRSLEERERKTGISLVQAKARLGC